MIEAALVLSYLFTPFTHADLGADSLLFQPGVVKSDPGTSVNNPSLSFQDLKLSDPFLMQLFSQWQAQQSKLPFEVNAWVLRILKGEFTAAAHQWSSLQKVMPADFEISARVAYVYLLDQLNLTQTFVDQFLQAASIPQFLESPLNHALEMTLASTIERTLVDHAITFMPDQWAAIQKLDFKKGPVELALRSVGALRKGKEAQAVLELLPASSPFKAELAETVALSYARLGEIQQAAKIFKLHLEPALEYKKDPKLLAAYYLQIARLLFQIGAIEGAEQFYEKIPNGVNEYLTAREELIWIRLKRGDLQKLRGDLKTLTSKYFDDRFAPESDLVRAVSNLKLCFYDEVEKDVKNFISKNQAWAEKITAALRSPDAPAPRVADYFSNWSLRARLESEKESARLGELSRESINAVLPAVGAQAHWAQAQARLGSVIEAEKKIQNQEFARHWKTDQAALLEAIRKMKFVRVELLTQLRASGDALPLSQAAPLNTKGGEMVFPFDGVMWPDEMFKLRSTAQSRCLAEKGKP